MMYLVSFIILPIVATILIMKSVIYLNMKYKLFKF